MSHRGIAWNPDGTIIALGGSRRVDLFDLEHGFVKTLKCMYNASVLAWSPNGKSLAVGGKFCVCVIDLETEKVVWQHYRNRVNVGDLQWNQQGTVLAAAWGWPDQCVRLYDLEGKTLQSLVADHSVHSLAWTEEGLTLVSAGNDHEVRWWNPIAGKQYRSLAISRDPIESMDTCESAGTGILVSSDGTMRLFSLNDLPLCEQQLVVPPGPSRIQKIQWHPEVPGLLAVRSSQLVHAIDLNTGKIIRSFSELSNFCDFDWHPKHRSITILESNGNIKHYSVETGDTIGEWRASSVNSPVSIRWSPNGRQLLVGTGQNRMGNEKFCFEVIDTFDMESREFFGEFSPQSVASWSPDASRVIVFSSHGEAKVQLWDVASRTLAHQSETVKSNLKLMDYSSGGNKIAMGGSNGALVVINASTAKIIARLHADSDGLGSVKWSPNENRLLTCADDGTLRLWDSSTLDLVLTLDTDIGSVADWSPDGRRVATCTSDGTLRIWDGRQSN